MHRLLEAEMILCSCLYSGPQGKFTRRFRTVEGAPQRAHNDSCSALKFELREDASQALFDQVLLRLCRKIEESHQKSTTAPFHRQSLQTPAPPPSLEPMQALNYAEAVR